MTKKIFLLSPIFSLFLLANDLYTVNYEAKNGTCKTIKNGKVIPLFDTRFKKDAPKNSYSCSMVRKEQYNSCKIVAKKNIAALVFAYGRYETTNLIVSFKSPSKSVDASMTVECTKKLK